MLSIGHYLFLTFALFLVGVAGALLRRNAAVIAMSAALIVTAAAINFVVFSRFFADPNGQNFALILSIAALAEAIVFTALFAKRSETRDVVAELTAAAADPSITLPPPSDTQE